jgi:hypothetical protein
VLHKLGQKQRQRIQTNRATDHTVPTVKTKAFVHSGAEAYTNFRQFFGTVSYSITSPVCSCRILWPQIGHKQKRRLPSWQPEVIVLIELFGRGERIRTSDLTVPNLNAVKNLSF